jgi:hypothetical protein
MSAVCAGVAAMRTLALHERHGFDLTIVSVRMLAARLLRSAVLPGPAVGPSLTIAVRPPAVIAVAVLCWLGGRGGARRGTLVAAPVGRRNFQPDQLLDVAQERNLVAVAKGDGNPFGASAGGAADAVDLALVHVRQVVIEDVAYDI